MPSFMETKIKFFSQSLCQLHIKMKKDPLKPEIVK